MFASCIPEIIGKLILRLLNCLLVCYCQYIFLIVFHSCYSSIRSHRISAQIRGNLQIRAQKVCCKKILFFWFSLLSFALFSLNLISFFFSDRFFCNIIFWVSQISSLQKCIFLFALFPPFLLLLTIIYLPFLVDSFFLI